MILHSLVNNGKQKLHVKKIAVQKVILKLKYLFYIDANNRTD